MLQVFQFDLRAKKNKQPAIISYTAQQADQIQSKIKLITAQQSMPFTLTDAMLIQPQSRNTIKMSFEIRY